ncbi:hypothetical protein NB689_003104 [Xanthomonas sacchari]|nr:hypothetical protein [Xanthomonas sacchari]
MAEAVVDRLEMVHVDHQHRDRRPLACGIEGRRLAALPHHPAVGHPGERILRGVPPQFRVHFAGQHPQEAGGDAGGQHDAREQAEVGGRVVAGIDVGMEGPPDHPQPDHAGPQEMEDGREARRRAHGAVGVSPQRHRGGQGQHAAYQAAEDHHDAVIEACVVQAVEFQRAEQRDRDQQCPLQQRASQVGVYRQQRQCGGHVEGDVAGGRDPDVHVVPGRRQQGAEAQGEHGVAQRQQQQTAGVPFLAAGDVQRQEHRRGHRREQCVDDQQGAGMGQMRNPFHRCSGPQRR